MSNCRIGVDLGGTNVRVALVDRQGLIVKELSDKTEVEREPDYVISKIARMINELKCEGNVSDVGIGAPGPLDAKAGFILDPPNLPGWTNIPIVELIEKRVGLNVVLDNDANAAALAESIYGSGRGYSSVYYLTVSTGIGGGFVINGNLFQGAQGYAGEIGNMIIVPNGRKQSSLNAGALEALASGTAIARDGRERLGISGGAEEVFTLAEKGNVAAQKIIEKAINYLAIGIANLAHAVNPEIFVLGGGVMQSEKQVLEPLRKKVKEYLYPGLKDTIRIVPAGLGTKAGIVGASLLPIQK
jgi:glucokinase